MDFPIPSSKVMFFDLDKTLIDGAYQLTDERFFVESARLMNQGWVFGLHSDTPLLPLLEWRHKLKLNGPVIAERGSILWTTGEAVILQPGYLKFFAKLQKQVVAHLMDSDYAFYFGDATQVIRNQVPFPHLVEKDLVFVQKYRQCSFGLFARTVDAQGNLKIDPELIAEVATIVYGLAADAGIKLLRDLNSEYGFYTISPAEVTKRVGLLAMMTRMGIADVGMVGDSDTDLVGGDIAWQYAVGNATGVLKEVADYTSAYQYTEGVVDILSRIG